jgi:hypothetical protein
MRLKPLFPLPLFAFVLLGCSRLDCYSSFDQTEPYNWGGAKEAPFSCRCDSFAINVGVGTDSRWRIVGPPFVPLLPYPISWDGDRVKVTLLVEPNPRYPKCEVPDLVIYPTGCNVQLKPVKTGILSQYPERFWCEWDFDVSGHLSDTLQLVFPSKYNGCDLPSLTLHRTRRIKYESLEFPGNN